MIKTKDELATKIKPLCEKVLFDKEKVSNLLQEMQTSFNIPTGMTMDLLTGRIVLENANEFILFALCVCLDYKIYVNKEDIYEDGTKVFKYPMYRICLKEKNKPYITIEIL